VPDPDAQRAEIAERWERAAAGWGRRASEMRSVWMPVSAWMVDHLALQPGQRVLELAAGPGDTGFLASELVAPGGILISSDASAPMLKVARARAREFGIANVEFIQLELEWIDLPTASVDAVLCRWALMLIVDPTAAAREMRRVLRPGGRAAMAVWGRPEDNPWATVPTRALVELGHVEAPDPEAPGMFALSRQGLFADTLEEAGFVDVVEDSVDLTHAYATVREYVEQRLDLSVPFAQVYERLDAGAQAEVERVIDHLAGPYREPDGSLRLPGRSLVAVAGA
jgi:ubiquinone/menaquinone biosynthesis C-methylase UbiE